MATITNAVLTLAHDHRKKTVQATAKCRVNFTELELCQMKNCAGARFFKLKCQLWGEDSGLNFGDDFLFTYSQAFAAGKHSNHLIKRKDLCLKVSVTVT